MRSARSPGRATVRRWARWAKGPFALDRAVRDMGLPLYGAEPAEVVLSRLPAELQAEARLVKLPHAVLTVRERARCAAGLVPTQLHPLYEMRPGAAWFSKHTQRVEEMWEHGRPDGRVLVVDLRWRCCTACGWQQVRLGKCSDIVTAHAVIVGAEMLGWHVVRDRGAELWWRANAGVAWLVQHNGRAA